MKILVFTAIQGRQHITDLFLMGIKRLKMFSGHDLKLFCVCSDLDDGAYLQVRGIDYCVAPNSPLSDKMQHGFQEALKFDFDYMLRLGSDDLLDHNIFKLHYNDLMNAGIPYFGLKTIGIIEFTSLESIVYKYNTHRQDMILGGGSMLSRDLCMKLKGKAVYNRKPIDRGLDNESEYQIKKQVKVLAVTTTKPMLLDIKSEVNIWPFKFVSKRMKTVPFKEISHFISQEEDRYLRRKGKNFDVIAIIPVKGRKPLVKHTIERLLKKNEVSKVICVVDSNEDHHVCKAAGAEAIPHFEKTLGAKWNIGFMKAKEYSPDACLFVGSSDWISDNWIEYCEPYIGEYDMVGKPDFTLLDYGKEFRVCHWAGYTDPRRKGEPIGIGRLLSRRILDLMDWQPMDPKLDSSLDYSMWQKVLNMGGKVGLLTTDDIKSLSLSTDAWVNKHRFEDHWTGKLPSKKIEAEPFLKKYFPEAYQL